MRRKHFKIQTYLASLKEKDDVETRARLFGKSVSTYVRDLIMQDLFLAKREDPSSIVDLELSLADQPLPEVQLDKAKLIKKIPKLMKDGDNVSIDDIFDAMGVK